MKCLESPEGFYEIYAPQKGGFFRVYKAYYGRQKGAGIGGIFGTIARKLLPFITEKVLPFARKHVLPFAAKAAKNVALDLVHGKTNLKSSVLNNSGDALKGIVNSSLGQSGGGAPRKRTRSKSCQKRKTKKPRTSTQKSEAKTKIIKGGGNRKKSRKRRGKKKTRDLIFKRSIFD